MRAQQHVLHLVELVQPLHAVPVQLWTVLLPRAPPDVPLMPQLALLNPLLAVPAQRPVHLNKEQWFEGVRLC